MTFLHILGSKGREEGSDSVGCWRDISRYMFSVSNSPLSRWTTTKSSALGFPVHLSQLDSLSVQSPCSCIPHHSLVSSLSLSCSPSVTTHLHLPLPSAPPPTPLPAAAFIFTRLSSTSGLEVSGKQQFQASELEIPTQLPPTTANRGCSKNPSEVGKREERQRWRERESQH